MNNCGEKKKKKKSPNSLSLLLVTTIFQTNWQVSL